jgi:hypothetical protein
MTAIGQSKDDLEEAGASAPIGSFICVDCSFPVSLSPSDEVPSCPNCGSETFRRASMFEQPTLDHVTLDEEEAAPTGWLAGLRDSIQKPGKYLALHADGKARLLALSDGWSRIGRSSSADIRLDDPTVSRRHAVVVQTPEGQLRALDDRSMNGIAVNGESVEWSALSDGDQLQIGRYTLHVIESAGKPAHTA